MALEVINPFFSKDGMGETTDKKKVRIFSMNKKIAEEIEKKAVDNRLPCPAARKIAQDLAVAYKEVGETADALKIKITHCELGCF
jgi:hypothetical protein